MENLLFYLAGLCTPLVLYIIAYAYDEYEEYKEDLKGRHGDR